MREATKNLIVRNLREMNTILETKRDPERDILRLCVEINNAGYDVDFKDGKYRVGKVRYCAAK